MSKKKRIKITILLCSLLITICSLILFSCHNSFTPSIPGTTWANPPPGKGAFFLSLTVDNPGRTILPIAPQKESLYYTLDFTVVPGGNGGTALLDVKRDYAGLATPVYLVPGTYSLTVTAFLDEDQTKLVAQGKSTSNIVIGEGGSTSASIILRAIIADGDGVGSFKYTVTFPATVQSQKATMAVNPLDTTNGTVVAPVTLASGISGTINDLKTGYYNVVITLEMEDGDRMVWREMLHVYTNLESSFSQSFLASDFYKTRYTVTFDFGDGREKGTTSVSHGSTATNNQGTPTRTYTPEAGLYQRLPDDLPTAYTFVGWYYGDEDDPYNFSTTVTKDITLTAVWSILGRTPVDVNQIPAAFEYVRTTPGYSYTLLLDATIPTKPIFTDSNTLVLEDRNLTIIGLNGECIIQANTDRFVTITGGRLVLGNYITLNGRTGATNSLVSVNSNGSLTMDTGSKITGHTNITGASLNDADGNGGAIVSVVGATFTMNGGEITGSGNNATQTRHVVYLGENGNLRMEGDSKISKHIVNSVSAVYMIGANSTFTMEGGEISENSTTGSMYNASGGVIVSGTGASFVMSGGKIIGNNNISSPPGKPADVSILDNTITLSGIAEIGALELSANSSSHSTVTIPAAYTGNVTALNLGGDANSISSVNEVVGNWRGKNVITGAGVTAAVISRFTLGNFVANTVTRPITGNTTEGVDNFYIGTTVPDIGKLLVSPVAVTGITLNNSTLTLKRGETATLSATVTPSNATSTLIWSSNATGIATLSENGNSVVITGVARGTATITVKADDIEKTCTVTVFEGSGILDTDPYQIYNETDLRRVGTGEAGWNLSASYKLMANIALTDTWTPVGTNTTPFTGTFDGNGLSISNLSIPSATAQYQGMFGYISSNAAAVKNLALVNVTINTSSNNVGGVVGSNYGGTVQNCYTAGNVSGNNYIGGVVGATRDGGMVQNCYAIGNVSGNDNIGGVVGDNYGTVQNCYATGNVSGNNYIGGIVGTNNTNYTVRNCVALNPNITITTTSQNIYFGRVIGVTEGGTRTNNYARNDMQKSGEYCDWPNRGTAANDGADIDATQYGLDSWWNNTAAFTFGDTGAWDWHSTNKLPILKGFAANTQNPEVTPHTTVFITITIEEIIDLAPEITLSYSTIYRSAANGPTSLVLTAPAGLGTYTWTIPGVGAGQTVTSTGNTFEVSANNPNYNSIGGHTITLVVRIDGAPYSKTIDFEIRN